METFGIAGGASAWDGNYTYSCQQWADYYDITYPLITDSDWSTYDPFGNNYIPYHVVIDHTMTVRHSGNDMPSSSLINQYIQQLPDPSMELSLVHQDDWNMVGLPLGMEDTYYLSLFPDAVNNTLFSFGEGYSLETNLVEGTGYWLRFDEYGYNTMVGNGFEEITISLEEDWNMISGVSEAADVYAISDPYGLIVPNTIYSFGEGYDLTDVIEPGLGYWIRSYGEGNITISSTAVSAKSKFVSRLPDANSISFNGKTLHFGIEIPGEEILSYSLPPKPPTGAFDVRYEGDWSVAKDGGEIEIMNSSNKLKINYEVYQDTWVLVNKLTKEEYPLTNAGTIDIVGEVSGFTLKMEHASLPVQYALSQNYPNPFNPVTSISYSVPSEGSISLKVFDLLGEEVAAIVEGEHQSGNYTVQFDGSQLSSGVYFYKLTSRDYTLTKKLILMK